MAGRLIGILLIIGALYGVMEAWPLIAGPELRLDSPTEGATIPGGILDVSGNATRIARLTLNGLDLVHDQQGDFRTTLALPRGGSILTLEATDRFGKKRTISRSVVVP